MFHVYVTNSVNKKVDMGRAQFLMDKELVRDAIDKMTQPDGRCDDQWVWTEYCERHLEKYGEPFVPNVDPNWK